MKRSVGIFLFNNVEILDFSGPFEVFSTSARLCLRIKKESPFEIFTFSNFNGVITSRGGLKVIPDYSFKDVPKIDVLIIPGGAMDEPLNQKEVTQFIKKSKNSIEIIAGVCTGALLIANANLLQGLRATTHWEDLDALRQYKEVNVVSDVNFIDEGQILTSAGIASGITMSLHLVSRLVSPELANQTALQMEYRQWLSEIACIERVSAIS